MNKQTSFIVQVFIALGFILAVIGYTAAVSQAFVSTDTVLKVIKK